MYIKRERYLSKIRPFYDVDLIKVLTGVRRCGKSILLEQIKEEFIENGFDRAHIITINFEDLQFEKIRTAEKLNSYVNEQIKDHDKYLIFLDEIQHVRSFEKVLASFRATLNCSIFITGSNSKLLSGKMATLLVGRCVEFRIMPFSFAESYEYATAIGRNISPDEFMIDYINWGGFPLRFSFTKESDIKRYLEQTYEGILDKDIITDRSKVNRQNFERVATYMLKFANGYVYINNQGYMLEISQELLELPIISGFKTPTENIKEGNRLVVEDLKELENVIKIMEIAKTTSVGAIIAEIDISDPTNYKIIIPSENKTVEFGDLTNINVKILKIEYIIEQEKGKQGEIYFQGAEKAVFREKV